MTYNNKHLFSTYVYYRLAMSILLTILFLSGLGERFLGSQSPVIFIYTGYIYIVFCSISLAMLLLQRLKPQASHIIFILMIDFICLVQMIYTSNNAIGGLSYLLLIPMAIGGTFLRGKTSVALAAFASLLILFNSIMNSLESSDNQQHLFVGGITGISLFLTAIAFRLLSKKLERSEQLIEEQATRAEYLQGISQRIIETIQAGIIVIDDDNNILLRNIAAEKLLTHNSITLEPQDIPDLKKALSFWQKNKTKPADISIHLGVNNNIKISFTPLSDANINSLMLFIEDENRINQEAQQLKLASLGRLTSSIAHEIRNPLGAISHASQLLDESESIDPRDQELLGMIQINSQRIDQTINNILQFSRRKQSSPKMINLCEWLTKFRDNYQGRPTSQMTLSFGKSHVYGSIDSNHLQQIISNLVDNAFHHGQKKGSKNMVHLEAHFDSQSKTPYINVIDEGNGIDEEDIHNIFEPFFTTKATGSGLGLYLCKELCQANQADIIYIKKTATQKSCFRLLFGEAKQKSISS